MKGSIREQSKGVWELRVYTGRDPSTKKPRQKSVTFRGGKRAATTALAKLVNDAADGRHGGSHATLGVLLDAWLASTKGRVSPATYVIYEDTIDRIKTTSVVLVRLSRLSALEIDQCFTTLRERGTTAHQMVQTHRYLKTALRQGVKWGWLPGDPTEQAHRPATPRTKSPLTSVAEFLAIVGEADQTDPDLAAIIFLAGLTGLRRGELCGLGWSDIEPTRIVLRRNRVKVRGEVVELHHTKGRQEGEEDIVQLDELATVVFHELRVLQSARAMSLGIDLPADGYLLSTDGMGNTPRRPDTFTNQVTAAGKRAGVKTNPHKMQHFTVISPALAA